jgi:hypothetical protein
LLLVVVDQEMEAVGTQGAEPEVIGLLLEPQAEEVLLNHKFLLGLAPLTQ